MLPNFLLQLVGPIHLSYKHSHLQGCTKHFHFHAKNLPLYIWLKDGALCMIDNPQLACG